MTQISRLQYREQSDGNKAITVKYDSNSQDFRIIRKEGGSHLNDLSVSKSAYMAGRISWGFLKGFIPNPYISVTKDFIDSTIKMNWKLYDLPIKTDLKELRRKGIDQILQENKRKNY